MTAVIDQQAEPSGWVSCRRCRSLVYAKRLQRALGVCPDCGYHNRVDAHERLDQLLDEGSIDVLDLQVHSGDPLNFVDSKPYSQRFTEARRSTGLDHGALCAAGEIEGNPLI